MPCISTTPITTPVTQLRIRLSRPSFLPARAEMFSSTPTTIFRSFANARRPLRRGRLTLPPFAFPCRAEVPQPQARLFSGNQYHVRQYQTIFTDQVESTTPPGSPIASQINSQRAGHTSIGNFLPHHSCYEALSLTGGFAAQAIDSLFPRAPTSYAQPTETGPRQRLPTSCQQPVAPPQRRVISGIPMPKSISAAIRRHVKLARPASRTRPTPPPTRRPVTGIPEPVRTVSSKRRHGIIRLATPPPVKPQPSQIPLRVGGSRPVYTSVEPTAKQWRDKWAREKQERIEAIKAKWRVIDWFDEDPTVIISWEANERMEQQSLEEKAKDEAESEERIEEERRKERRSAWEIQADAVTERAAQARRQVAELKKRRVEESLKGRARSELRQRWNERQRLRRDGQHWWRARLKHDLWPVGRW